MIKEKPKRRIQHRSVTGCLAVLAVLAIAFLLLFTKITQTKLTATVTVDSMRNEPITIWGLYHREIECGDAATATPSLTPPVPTPDYHEFCDTGVRTLMLVNGDANYKVELDFGSSKFNIPFERWVTVTGPYFPQKEHIASGLIGVDVDGRIEIQSMKEGEWLDLRQGLQVKERVDLPSEGWRQSEIVPYLGWWNVKETEIPFIGKVVFTAAGRMHIYGNYAYIPYPDGVAHPPNGPIIRVESFYWDVSPTPKPTIALTSFSTPTP